MIQRKLSQLIYQPINMAIEDETIRLRRVHTIKLSDAMIAATALILGADLLTHDRALQAVMALETQPNAGV